MVPSLPSEVWDQILASLYTRTAKLNFALCSRNFYHIAIPHLYRHIHLERGSTDPGNDYYASRFPFVMSLTELLIRRPDRACLVRQPSVRGLEEPESGFEDGAKPVVIPGTIRETIDAYGWSDSVRQTWLTLARYGQDDAFVALLLTLLINLHALDLELYSRYRDLITWQVLRRGLTRPRESIHLPLFERLTDLVLPIGSWESRTTSVWDIGLLTHPSLKRFYCLRTTCSSLTSADKSLALLPSGSSAIESLELRACFLNQIDIATLLCIPKALHTFIYEIGPRDYNEFESLLSVPHLYRALKLQAHSLRHLSIRVSQEGHFSLVEESLSPIYTFIAFEHLESLTIPAALIFGHWDLYESDPDLASFEEYLTRLIPPRLCHLHISDVTLYWEVLYIALRALLRTVCTPTAPVLRHIQLSTCFEDSKFFERRRVVRQLHQLLDDAKAVDGRLEFVDDSKYN